MLQRIAVNIPNILPDFHFFRPAGRLIWSSLVLVAATGVVVTLCKRPKPAEPSTWAQSMLGAVITFALMLLAYGTVPHEWLTFANSYLKWDDSHYIIRNNVRYMPLNIPKSALKDVVATMLYVVFATTNIKLFAKWQKRPAYVAPDSTTTVEDITVGTSAYGKTLTAKG